MGGERWVMMMFVFANLFCNDQSSRKDTPRIETFNEDCSLKLLGPFFGPGTTGDFFRAACRDVASFKQKSIVRWLSYLV